MRRRLIATLAALAIAAGAPAVAGDAEVSAAQGTIESQLRAFQSDDGALAYSFAAPNVKSIFPTLEAFMGMVDTGYMPVRKPQHFSFGKAEERAGDEIWQQVHLVGPDGKDYEALYTLKLQPDGVWRITGVSLRASNALST